MAPSVTVTERDRYTVAGLIRHLARQQGDAEMLVQGEARRTWAGEFDTACRVAQAARRDGLDVGDRIAFLDRNGIAFLYTSNHTSFFHHNARRFMSDGIGNRFYARLGPSVPFVNMNVGSTQARSLNFMRTSFG